MMVFNGKRINPNLTRTQENALHVWHGEGKRGLGRMNERNK